MQKGKDYTKEGEDCEAQREDAAGQQATVRCPFIFNINIRLICFN